jgi:hypothetical protein
MNRGGAKGIDVAWCERISGNFNASRAGVAAPLADHAPPLP